MAGSELEVKDLRVFKVIFCCRNVVSQVAQLWEEVSVQLCNYVILYIYIPHRNMQYFKTYIPSYVDPTLVLYRPSHPHKTVCLSVCA